MLESEDHEDFDFAIKTPDINPKEPWRKKQKKKDKAADFTGRELLISSLEEKCYHEEIKADIQENGLIGKVIGAEVYDYEMLFIN